MLQRKVALQPKGERKLLSFIGGKTCAEPTWWLTHVRVNDGKSRHYLGIMIFNDIVRSPVSAT